jgi:acyl carrier protein
MLTAGAGIEIGAAPSATDASQLAGRLMAKQITTWDLPSSLMQNLLADIFVLCDTQKDLPGPRNILLTGEKQCVGLADKLARRFPNAQIAGLYASSAIDIWSTFFPLRPAPAESNCIAVAESIPGFEHRVLNKNSEPALFYTKGELHLRPTFPAGQPAVKTGLRAELLENGRLRWLRGDDHYFVKYECCVELTKIEAVLCRNEHIRAAEVVTIKTDETTGGPIVAFIIADPDRISAEAARDLLVLNEEVELIPDHFIIVKEFPLTPYGAIDHGVLAENIAVLPGSKNDARSLETEDILRRLKVIWLETLQLEDIGDDESFFASGGNSLKATLLIARISDEFSVDLSVQNFFRKPTLRAVSQLIAEESAGAGDLKKGPDFKVVSRDKYRVRLPETERSEQG